MTRAFTAACGWCWTIDGRIPGFLRVREALADLLFPPKCPFCGRILKTVGICAECREELPWTGEADGIRRAPDGFQCAAPLRYEDAVRDALLRMKFRKGSGLAEPLGRLISACAAERFPGGFDTVTWVPVSRRRKRRRGYDQARLLAESACRAWGVKPARLLVKIRDNPAQSGLESAAARAANVRDVYRALPAAAGRRVLLIDDICTTGSTLRAARDALLHGGAVSVVCAAAALTVEHG